MKERETKAMWLDNTEAAGRRVSEAGERENSNKEGFSLGKGDGFYWDAARNCVAFYLGNRPNNSNSRKHNSFRAFLALPATDAKQSNVWRWYFTTGGHPPYDPDERY